MLFLKNTKHITAKRKNNNNNNNNKTTTGFNLCIKHDTVNVYCTSCALLSNFHCESRRFATINLSSVTRYWIAVCDNASYKRLGTKLLFSA